MFGAAASVVSSRQTIAQLLNDCPATWVDASMRVSFALQRGNAEAVTRFLKHALKLHTARAGLCYTPGTLVTRDQRLVRALERHPPAGAGAAQAGHERARLLLLSTLPRPAQAGLPTPHRDPLALCAFAFALCISHRRYNMRADALLAFSALQKTSAAISAFRRLIHGLSSRMQTQ